MLSCETSTSSISRPWGKLQALRKAKRWYDWSPTSLLSVHSVSISSKSLNSIVLIYKRRRIYQNMKCCNWRGKGRNMLLILAMTPYGKDETNDQHHFPLESFLNQQQFHCKLHLCLEKSNKVYIYINKDIRRNKQQERLLGNSAKSLMSLYSFDKTKVGICCGVYSSYFFGIQTYTRRSILSSLSL